ncbi:hypothetical protein GCM10027562_07590 [Arthrobacter pigmenti]
MGLTVHLDRESVALPSERQPQLRRFDTDNDHALSDVLVQCGIPLHFVDGNGVWVVSAGMEDPDIPVAVVRQVPDATAKGSVAEVLFAVDRSPGQLVQPDGELYLYYRSAPGPVAEVVVAAQQGRAWQPDRDGLVDNASVREAVSAFADSPGQMSMIEVLRHSMGGRLLLDVTGSDPRSPQVRTTEGPGGQEALMVFTRQEELVRFHEAIGHPDAGEPLSLAVHGPTAAEMMMKRPELGWLYVDPAGPACALARPDIEFALQGKPNTRLKNALTESPEQQQIFTALAGGEGALFLAERESVGSKGPTTITAPGYDGPMLAVFTSAAEVAAFDASLKVRQFSSGWVLEFIFRQRLAGMVLNPMGPSATVSAFQIWHILANPAMDN